MTLSEFKAWFEGYTEGLEAAPTKAQFDRIKEKVKLIDGAPVTYPIYVDRYWPQPYRYPNYWGGGGTYTTMGQTTSTVNAVATVQHGFACAGSVGNARGDAAKAFDSHAAMYELGKVEASN